MRKERWKISLVGLVCALSFFYLICRGQSIPKLKVDGKIRLFPQGSLRLTPVGNTTPPYPREGDLYFDGTTLYLYNGTGWQEKAEEGEIFFSREENTLYYYNGTEWVVVGTGGGKTIATKIVAAYNSLGSTLEDGVTPCPGDGTPCFNPRADYTCDGEDDEQEIQQAIDDLGASGGAVYLLEGTYNLQEPLIFDDGTSDGIADSNKSLIGTGASTVLKDIGGSGIISTSKVSRIFISQLRVEGNNLGAEAIKFDNTQKSIINKVWIENSGEGVVLASSSENIFSSNFILSNNLSGVYLGNSSDNIISSNIIRNNQGVGVYLYGYPGESSNNIISGNQINNNGGLMANFGWGILLKDGCYNNLIIANQVNSNEEEAGIALVSQTYQSDTVKNNIISSNVISANQGYGIRINNANYNIITSNNIYNNTGSGINFKSANPAHYNNISGNLLSNNGGWGIELSGSSNLLSSNRILENLDGGINIVKGEENYLVGNYVNGTINDAGTHTAYIQKEKITIERNSVPVSDGATLDVATSPQGYVVFDTGGNDIQLGDPSKGVDAIADGKAVGDTLILEGPAAGSVTIPDGANTRMGGNIILNSEDTLTLLWNGADWLKVNFANN